MRWLVIGHSGTVGSDAVEGTPWPTLFAGALAAESLDPVSVETFRFWPSGPKAVGFALARVDDGEPDGVILDVNAFPAVVTFVSESVRKRFGERGLRLYSRFEGVARTGNRRNGRRGQPRSVAQRLARRVLGAAAHCDLDDSAKVFAEVLRGLVQREHLETVVISESSFGPRVRRLQPDLDELVSRLQAPSRAIALEHRIPWIDAGEFVRNDTEDGWAADHIHLNAHGNECYGMGLAAAILALRRDETERALRVARPL